MIEPPAPKFQWGQRVQAAVDLFNDGSCPDEPPESLLVRTGDAGEIVQVGTHVETNTPSTWSSSQAIASSGASKTRSSRCITQR